MDTKFLKASKTGAKVQFSLDDLTNALNNQSLRDQICSVHKTSSKCCSEKDEIFFDGEDSCSGTIFNSW